MKDHIVDKVRKNEKGFFILTAADIEDIIMYVDMVELYSEEVGYYTNNKYKNITRERRDCVYNAIVELLYSKKQ